MSNPQGLSQVGTQGPCPLPTPPPLEWKNKIKFYGKNKKIKNELAWNKKIVGQIRGVFSLSYLAGFSVALHNPNVLVTGGMGHF